MTKYGSWDGPRVGTGIALPATHPGTHQSHTPGTPPRTRYTQHVNAGYVTCWDMVVGLRSVDQLTLSPGISGSRGMTEVYNLRRIGRIDNHYCFPGND